MDGLNKFKSSFDFEKKIFSMVVQINISRNFFCQPGSKFAKIMSAKISACKIELLQDKQFVIYYLIPRSNNSSIQEYKSILEKTIPLAPSLEICDRSMKYVPTTASVTASLQMQTTTTNKLGKHSATYKDRISVCYVKGCLLKQGTRTNLTRFLYLMASTMN